MNTSTFPNASASAAACVAPPRDAVAAATHADPYPYYAALRRGPALVREAALGAWVASRADVIEAALADPALAVRPPQEPVPRALVGTPSGELFARLVRMNDGEVHRTIRPVLQSALAQVDAAEATALARRLCSEIVFGPAEAPGAADVSEAIFDLPVQAAAAMLGFADEALEAVAGWVRSFVACLSPLSSQAQLADASVAASALLDAFGALVNAQPAGHGTLLAAVRAQHAGSALPRDVLINCIGLLSQTCDATAGLVGNSLCALATHDALAARVATALVRDAGAQGEGAALLRAVVAETARWDAPVQNTRRFAAADTVVGGIAVARGDALVLLLGSANRDAARHPDADLFDIERAESRGLDFGHGRHACPGETLAHALAAGTLQALLRHPGLVDGVREGGWRYRLSVNARIPRFAAR